MKLKFSVYEPVLGAVRVQFGLSQADLGNAVGSSRYSVARWENGQAVPDLATAVAVCYRLNGKTLQDLCALFGMTYSLEPLGNREVKKQ